MYITGTINDFTSRLHQLPTGTSDLESFKTEVSGYWVNMSLQWREQLQNEARLKQYQLSGAAHTGAFNNNGGSIVFLTRDFF